MKFARLSFPSPVVAEDKFRRESSSNLILDPRRSLSSTAIGDEDDRKYHFEILKVLRAEKIQTSGARIFIAKLNGWNFFIGTINNIITNQIMISNLKNGDRDKAWLGIQAMSGMRSFLRLSLDCFVPRNDGREREEKTNRRNAKRFGGLKQKITNGIFLILFFLHFKLLYLLIN